MNKIHCIIRTVDIILTVIARLLGFIPFMTLAIIAVIQMLIKFAINYIVYGGEAIARSKHRKSIQDVYNRLEAFIEQHNTKI